MTCSCATSGITRQFDASKAENDLRRYRRKGPDRTTRMLIDSVATLARRSQLSEATLLDVGGGVGVIHHELVPGTVREVLQVDASPAFIAVARQEAARRGHAERVRFLTGDFIEIADEVDAADLVTLDRVICCYPNMDRLVAQSGAKARRFYGAVYPRDRRLVRVFVAIMNLVFRLQGTPFRSYVHPPSAIAERLRGAGLELADCRRTVVWEVAVFERRAQAA
jgi:magnesium-protoporphyrin O-methyltransferase